MTVLTDDRAPDIRTSALAGGKGRNLAALTAAGFTVPRWAILGTDAFDRALAVLGLQVSDAPLSLADRLREAARHEAALRRAPIPPAIREEIAAALRHVDSARVAVRSSAGQEDGSRHSFAGLFETALNVDGPAAVENAVRMCWASAFSARVTHYRYVRGLRFDDVALAVIVQQFLEPVSSGVMFTADPTGDCSRVLIDGVLGLCEGLVSGAVDSDAVVVDRATGRVLDEQVADKPLMVIAGGGGVQTVPVPGRRRREPAVPPALRTELVDLATRLERDFGGPQDTEWAYDGSRTWILQTRPITTLDNENDPPAEHLGEPVAEGELRIWDNSNIIESFSGVTSPLTFTVARQLYADVYRAYARSLNVPEPQLAQMESWLPFMLGQFNGHVYYNLLHWYRMVGIAPGYALNRRVLEVALGVSEPLDRATAKRLRPFTFRSRVGKAVARARITVTYARRYASINAMVGDFDRRFEDFIAREGFTDLSGLDGFSAYRHFRVTHDEVGRLWGPMLVLDAVLLTSVGLLAVLMKAFLPRAPEWVGFAVLNPVVDVESVEPARALAEIADFTTAAPRLREFLDTVDPAVAYRRLTDYARAGEVPEWRQLLGKIDDYIDRFGYRCLDELKLEAPDLRQNPAGLFQLLRLAALGDDQRSAKGAAQDYLDAHLGGVRRRIFDALRGKAQRGATHREHLRFCRTRGFGIIKALAAVMGRDLEHRGVIDSSDDVFQLRLDELFEVYEGGMPPAQVQAVVARRKMLDRRYRRLAAPARFSTVGSSYTEDHLQAAGWRDSTPATGGGQPPDAPVGTVLTGTPSSPGSVTGRAVVAERPEDFSGGILVAYRTEPGWAAALPFASALLVERASPLTHLAIIARELRVPTVVQIDGLTDAIRTGMTVSVDGSTGRVVVLEEQPRCGT